MPRLKVILLSLATLCAPVALAQTANPAVPGTINYVEGSASINGRTLNQQSVGYAQLQPDQVLQTANGRAELLLAPGVFLRVGENSAVRMVSPNLLNTAAGLNHRPSQCPPRRLVRLHFVDCRQPGHYTGFGVTSGWAVPSFRQPSDCLDEWTSGYARHRRRSDICKRCLA